MIVGTTLTGISVGVPGVFHAGPSVTILRFGVASGQTKLTFQEEFASLK
jgi:hypothetical protein